MVNITATGQGQRLSILEKTPPGFVVVNEEGGPVSYDRVAMAKVQEATTDPQEAEQQVAHRRSAKGCTSARRRSRK